MIVIGRKANLLQRSPSWFTAFPSNDVKSTTSTTNKGQLYQIPVIPRLVFHAHAITGFANSAFPAVYPYRGRVMKER